MAGSRSIATHTIRLTPGTVSQPPSPPRARVPQQGPLLTPLSWPLDPVVQTFFFDGRCEGQMMCVRSSFLLSPVAPRANLPEPPLPSLACPNRDGSPHSGLVDFHLGVVGLTSTFFTNDINVKGVTSDLQSVLASSGKVTVKAAWGDLQVTCRY